MMSPERKSKLFILVVWASCSVGVVESYSSLADGDQTSEQAPNDMEVKVHHARCGEFFQVLPDNRGYSREPSSTASPLTDSAGGEGGVRSALASSTGFSNPVCYGGTFGTAAYVTTDLVSTACRTGTDSDHTVEVWGADKVRCASRLVIPSLPDAKDSVIYGPNADGYFNSPGVGFQSPNAWTQFNMDNIFCMEERNPSSWDEVMKKPKAVPYAVRITHDLFSLGSVGDSDGSFYIYKVSGSNKFVVRDVVFTRCGFEHYQGCCGLANMTEQTVGTDDQSHPGFVHKWGGWTLASTNQL